MKYSQNDEESHILRIVGDQTGRFLDIGAYNPKLFSNTRRLFELGWSGVMVEASPGPFLDLLTEYGKSPTVQLVCAAVTPLRGLVRFHHSEAGVGTTSESHYQKWRDTAAFEGDFWTSGLPLGDLISQFGSGFDFVNIDVEGASASLFFDALWNHKLRPKCWCVEHDGRHEDMTAAVLKAGYCREHLNGENVIFARQDGHDGN
jgi:FkbM family methyltransferase